VGDRAPLEIWLGLGVENGKIKLIKLSNILKTVGMYNTNIIADNRENYKILEYYQQVKLKILHTDNRLLLIKKPCGSNEPCHRGYSLYLIVI
jgi:hypothetical protein